MKTNNVLKDNAKKFLATKEAKDSKRNRWEEYLTQEDIKNFQMQNDLKKRPIIASNDKLVPVKKIHDESIKQSIDIKIDSKSNVMKELLKDRLVKN